MKLILSSKDTTCKITLQEVQYFAQEGETLLVVFEDGRVRNYPFMHIWYYESDADDHRAVFNKTREVPKKA